MSDLVKPVFTGNLNGHRLRFFKAPTDQPQLMWHSWDDLVASASLPRSMRREFKRKLQDDYGAEVRTVATAEGITTIAPHYMAQGFIGSMMELGFAPPSTDMSYTLQSVEAWNALTANLPDRASRDLLVAAYRNSNKLDGAGA